ncbi:MAG: copper-binding protein [Gammaproteobacteria bacterium]|nr:copper-binding protein [Gammaproteobacteria bacterium]
MNIKHSRFTGYSLYALMILLGIANVSFAQQAGVLDPAQHPQSPEYKSVFAEEMVPLDASLSWTERFNGDETFNSAQTLEQSSSITSTISSNESSGEMSMDSESMSGMKMDARGVVKTIRAEQGKVKIEHGPIDKYEMPGMTMMFKVDDPVMLEGLEPGAEVGFDVDNTSGGFVIIHIMPKMAMMSDQMEKEDMGMLDMKMDARGVVKTVRAEQGKVKIEHGPIDKYGMPAMTMMFKVENPELLEGLDAGAQVDFDVDNSSGGFVITNIEPASK